MAQWPPFKYATVQEQSRVWSAAPQQIHVKKIAAAEPSYEVWGIQTQSLHNLEYLRIYLIWATFVGLARPFAPHHLHSYWTILK